MRSDGEYLFTKYDLGESLRNQEKAMYNEIDAINGDQLLKTSVDDWCDYFEQKNKGDVPVLDEANITTGYNEVNIDVRGEANRVIFDRNKPFYITGTKVTFFVPFIGDHNFFYCQASARISSQPKAIVEQKQLLLTYVGTDLKPDEIKDKFNTELSKIRQGLDWIGKDLVNYNAKIKDNVRARIEIRKQKLLNDKGLVASLGFPLKRDAQAANTYVVPTVRKKMLISMPSAGSTPFMPEPTIDIQKYEEILSILTNMVKVMERSPSAFKGMKEEDLRQHFLVQLNGQYEGQATGETFNFEGKTDILIREKDRNIFIAECAFWEGEVYLTKKVNQLLGYASWRDTKTAIILFNQNKNLTNVLSQIPKIIASHSNFKRKIESYKNETGFRFIMHHKDDTNRELTLTVLVFEVPV